MITTLREVLFLCSVTTAIVSGIAAITIAVAIATDSLQDPQAWVAVVFFVAIGIIAWIVCRLTKEAAH